MRVYFPFFSIKNSALTSSLSPLLIRKIGCPVELDIACGVEAPLRTAFKVSKPVFVGFPSGDTQGTAITAS